MSLAFSFLREQVIEKRDAHDKQNASEEARINTIKNNIHVIESCTHSAPEIIGIFKERFAEYQKEKAQPSTWEKIQIAFARMWNTQTKKEEKYTQAKGNLRSLANTRKMATRGLRKLSSDEQTVISRDALVEKLNNPQYQTDTLQKKF